jgi:hypothetical protein
VSGHTFAFARRFAAFGLPPRRTERGGVEPSSSCVDPYVYEP